MMQGKNRLFAHTALDIIPVLAGVAHLLFVWGLIVFYADRPLWLNLLLGVIYAISISWNINGVSHNFIHNPYFAKPWMNKAFSLVESLAIGFSQIFYHWVHVRHHIGNSDVPDSNGNSIDWLSIYRHGRNGKPESVWNYTFLSFFRDDLGEIYRSIKRKSKFNAAWGRFELYAFIASVIIGLLYDWQAMLFFLPFYYLGHCLSSLNGYYEHLNGNPALPIAWGVSSYNRLYNVLWFGNGYHAEHHYRPRTHWTKIHALHQQIAAQQREAGVHVIATCHALGFLARSNRMAQPKG